MSRIRSRPDTSNPNTAKRGSFKPIIHESEKSNATRDITAIERPSVRARFRSSKGSLPARIEMKMTLSTPRTSSSEVSIKREIQICGSISHSICRYPVFSLVVNQRVAISPIRYTHDKSIFFRLQYQDEILLSTGYSC